MFVFFVFVFWHLKGMLPASVTTFEEGFKWLVVTQSTVANPDAILLDCMHLLLVEDYVKLSMASEHLGRFSVHRAS
jgi:hypothetical protein